jgi:hypothetical protein
MTEEQSQPSQNTLASPPATLTATVQITRAATGKVETHELIFTPLPADQQSKEAQ